MGFKIKKKKKSKNFRGNTTHGHGARKKWKGSGHHGGVGMAGTGKRADQKKSLVIKLFGNNYFGKQG
jgi:large subunit ribosomal protein L15